MNFKSYKTLLLVITTVSLAGCFEQSFKRSKDKVSVNFKSKSGSSVVGQVSLEEKENKVILQAKVSGLDPYGMHGFHIHEKGDCSSSDAKSAGGHFAPDSKKHGGPTETSHHFGDLGNIQADAKGTATIRREIEKATLENGKYSLTGRALIIHKKADDLESQPSGNAGSRVACAEIVKVKSARF